MDPNVANAVSPEALERVSDQIALDADAVRARAEAVLAEDLYWFPVRHHSPAVARHLESAILARRPKVVLIEGPSEATDLIPYVVDSKTHPPVAIYSSYRDDDNVLGLAGIASPAKDIPPRFACWYPLVGYSPEYIAMKAAARIKAKVVFIDLPHHALIEPHVEEEDEPSAQDPSGKVPGPDSAPSQSRGKKYTVEFDAEHLIVESRFYQKLAEVAGYRNWNEAWDSLFEKSDFGDDTEAFRRELATFCAAARATCSPRRIEADGTLARERFMWRTIGRTLKKEKIRPREAMVVCGGFHLFLDRDDATPPPEAPSGTVYTTVMPYSFFRISELSGYAAGNRAPQFYQTCFELARDGRADDVLVEHVVAVLKRARREGEHLSSADAIAASQHARLLANLRGRAQPVLDDIQDALITCCCKGDPADEGMHLLQAIDAVNIGTKVGRVTPALGRLPLVNDFYGQLDDLDLGEVMGREKQLTTSLDKREELDARRSAFLHRLLSLDVPIGQMIDAPSGDFDTGMIFREKWALRWSPKVEPALIEKSLYGDTLQAAALGRLQEQLADDRQHAGKTCGHLVRAIDMDLPQMVTDIEKACGDAIDADVRFVSLTTALGHLAVLDRYAAYRNLRRDVLEDLLVRCFDRACFSIPEVASVPEDQQEEVVAALLSLAELLLRSDDSRLDRALFAEHVRGAADQSQVPFLRGAFLGMLAEIRQMDPVDLAAEVSAYARASADEMARAGDFVDGIMAVSRTSIMLGADALVGAIDDLLRAADWDVFLTMIPRLRAAFERLHERQCDAMAQRVAVRYGLSDEGESLTELRTSVGAAALIARIDRQVAEVMKEWEF
ncbi:MAG: hypothetical protein JW818_17375 [Pirellulales bacterium]|nr:hypothetical protein [Pirellulales bacterium]